jgi:hypothetical protein
VELEREFYVPEVPHEHFVRIYQRKLGREDIFKTAIGNEGLHEINYVNGVGIVNFATPINLIVKSICFHIERS